MKTSEMMRIFEDDKTPFGTEFKQRIANNHFFRAVKCEWGHDKYTIRFYRDDKRVNEHDAFITSDIEWELVEEKRVELTIKDIEQKLGYKISIVD